MKIRININSADFSHLPPSPPCLSSSADKSPHALTPSGRPMNPAHAHDAQSKRDFRAAPTGGAAPGGEREARGEGGHDGREAKDAAPALLTGRSSSPGGAGQEGRPRGGSLTLRGGGARGRQVVLCAAGGNGDRSSLSFLAHDDLRAYAYEGDASPSGSLTSTVMGAARTPRRN